MKKKNENLMCCCVTNNLGSAHNLKNPYIEYFNTICKHSMGFCSRVDCCRQEFDTNNFAVKGVWESSFF